jgi:hypothetical protein
VRRGLLPAGAPPDAACLSPAEVGSSLVFGTLAGAAALRADSTWDAARTALAEMLAAETSSSTELVVEVPDAACGDTACR